MKNIKLCYMKGIVNMGKIKELKYYDVQKVGTIKELLEIAVEQAGDKIAFKYKDEKGKVIRAYEETEAIYQFEDERAIL